MSNKQNIMILNGIDIGISKIELNESNLLITDKSGKYCLTVCVAYNWKDINSIEIGQKKNIDFNEYYLSENNEPVLILPTDCYCEKLSKDSIIFYLKFDNFSDACYMNKRGYLDIELKSLECKIFIDYKDIAGNSIVYEF